MHATQFENEQDILCIFMFFFRRRNDTSSIYLSKFSDIQTGSVHQRGHLEFGKNDVFCN